MSRRNRHCDREYGSRIETSPGSRGRTTEQLESVLSARADSTHPHSSLRGAGLACECDWECATLSPTPQCYTIKGHESAIQRLQRLMDSSGTQFPTGTAKVRATTVRRHIRSQEARLCPKPRVIKHDMGLSVTRSLLCRSRAMVLIAGAP